MTSIPDEARFRRTLLVLSSCMMTVLSSVWVGTYVALGLWLSAAIPFVYQLTSAAGICFYARGGRGFRLFRTTQLWMSLTLPFALQWSLGGFARASAVSLWSFTSPVGALLFVGARQAAPWFLAFGVFVAGSGAADSTLAASAPRVPSGVVVTFFVLNVLGVTATAYVLLQCFIRGRDRALVELEVERRKSQALLVNILPTSVSDRLKESERVIADAYADATVLFADIVDFTALTHSLPPGEVVLVLDRVFACWDGLAARHGVEKIKTIGDSYMAAGGLLGSGEDHAEAVADMALEMRSEIELCGAESGVALNVRIGIATGPVVAGVIGRAKFIYDVWGDTVNTASRMESHGLSGAIQVTERAYTRLRDRYDLRPRGSIEVKGKGAMTTYLLVGRRDEPNTHRQRSATAIS